MPLFTKKQDIALPKLTQFYQLSIPEDWHKTQSRPRRSFDKAEASSLLIETELDQWLLRHVTWEDASEAFRIPLDDEEFENPTCFSNLIPVEYEAQAVLALEKFASLHKDVTGLMNLLTNQDALEAARKDRQVRLNIGQQESELTRIMKSVNSRMQRASLGYAFHYSLQTGIHTVFNKVESLETALLTDLFHASSITNGETGGLARCPVCNSAYVKIAKHVYCSSRCYDRALHRNCRQAKKANSD